MIFETQIMHEQKSIVDKMILRQYTRLKKQMEKVEKETDEKKRAAWQSVIDANREELATIKEYCDLMDALSLRMCEDAKTDRAEAFSKGLRQGIKQQDNFGFQTVGDFRAYREAKREAQRIIWQDHD